MPLLVKDLMSGFTKSVIPETCLAEVVSLMRLHHVECLPVAVNKCLVGYVRLQDILEILYSGDADIGTEASKQISNLQNSNAAIIRADIRRIIFDRAITVPPSMPINKAMAIMQRHQVSSLAVSEGNEMVGMVNLEDITKAIMDLASTRAAA